MLSVADKSHEHEKAVLNDLIIKTNHMSMGATKKG